MIITLSMSTAAQGILTYDRMTVEEHTGPFGLIVVFHQIEKHPRIPEAIQSLVDGLNFQVRGQLR